MMATSHLTQAYAKEGFFVLRDYFSADELFVLRNVILKFHALWTADHKDFYQTEAFNASLITGSQYLQAPDRLSLFQFISSKKMMALIKAVITEQPVFMNTQLFFNPLNPRQKDFWHRDCQYDFDIAGQKRVITETQVVHLRVPLFDELGMELVPGTHQRWDNEEEYNVRQEEKGRHSSENLSLGQTIELAAGDILVFSADMIHRGLYGKDRLALDILVFDAAADYINYIDDDCLPDSRMLDQLEDPALFQHALQLKLQSMR